MAGTTQMLWTLMRNRSLSADALRTLQEKKLAALLRHAYHKVPYYTSLFQAAGLLPEDIRTLDDLEHVPTSDKSALRAAGPAQVLAQGVDPETCWIERTSGSSGKLFPVYLGPHEFKLRALVRLRASVMAGRRPRDVLCNLGRAAPPKGSLYERLGLYRTRYLSHYLSLKDQARELQQIKPDMIRTWPPSLRALLHSLDYRLSSVARPRALITAGEPLDPSLATRLRADLPIELFNFYTAAECGEIAGDCPAHEGLHVHADTVLVEILREDGSPAEPGEEGTVVVTSLEAYTMPFIRYRLGDRCATLAKPCSCGLSFPLIAAPLGRLEDVVRVPSGDIRSATALTSLVRLVAPIDQFRFTQERLDRIVLQVVLWKEPEAAALPTLRAKILAYLREPMEVEVQVVDTIPEQKFKFRRFVSLLNASEPSTEAP